MVLVEPNMVMNFGIHFKHSLFFGFPCFYFSLSSKSFQIVSVFMTQQLERGPETISFQRQIFQYYDGCQCYKKSNDAGFISIIHARFHLNGKTFIVGKWL